ncbi:hypothetical protein J6590_084319 [Homalodisca vitripennis]|nr:hypothetical protein J6590_084319 [Homalodisca vitripennis]
MAFQKTCMSYAPVRSNRASEFLAAVQLNPTDSSRRIALDSGWGKYPSKYPNHCSALTLSDQLTNSAQSVLFTAATRSVEPVVVSSVKKNCESETRSTQLTNRYKKVLVPLPTPTPGGGLLLRNTAKKFASAQVSLIAVDL